MSGEPECGKAQSTDLEVVTIDSIRPDGMQLADFKRFFIKGCSVIMHDETAHPRMDLQQTRVLH